MDSCDDKRIKFKNSTMDFTNNTLASSFANLSIRDNTPLLDNKLNTSVVQSTTVKNSKENNDEDNKTNDNGLLKSFEENENSKSVQKKPISFETLKKKTTKEVNITLADKSEYTIPPAIAEDVLREMLANKPTKDLLEELESAPVLTNGKSENSSSSKIKGVGSVSIDFSTKHEKNDSTFPPKFNFPNIEDKNFFLPNFTNLSTKPSLTSFSFGNFSESSSQNSTQKTSVPPPALPSLSARTNISNPVTTSNASSTTSSLSPSSSSSSSSSSNNNNSSRNNNSNNVATNDSQQKDQKRVTIQLHPPVLDKFSPQLPSKTPSITMPSSSIWPPQISTSSPTDTHFSNSNLLFSQFTGSFKFDISPKSISGGSPSNYLPQQSTTNTTPPTTSSTKPPNKPTISSPSIISSSTASGNKKGVQNNINTASSSSIKKISIKFGDISNTTLASSVSTKGPTINVNSNNNGTPSSSLQTSPPRGFAHNATNTFPFYRPIRPLPSRAKSRLLSNANLNNNDSKNANNSNTSTNINNNNSISSMNKSNNNNSSSSNSDSNNNNSDSNSNNDNNFNKNFISNIEFFTKSDNISASSTSTISQQSVPVIPPSPLFSFATPTNSEDDDDFDADDDDGSNDNGHTDWLDNANNKKKRKALQTVGISSTTSSGIGGVMKNVTAKERTNPLRRVERSFDNKSVNKETYSMRPPQTTFDFSFKSITEKSAAAAAASVNAASAKRLAAVSPIQTMNSKNEPFSSSLFLQQSHSTVITINPQNNSKKKTSTKRSAPSSSLFKNEDSTHNNNQYAKVLPPPLPPTTPKRLPNAGRKKNKKKSQSGNNNNNNNNNNNQNIPSQHPPHQNPHQHNQNQQQQQQQQQHQQDDTSSTSGSVDIQPAHNNTSRRRIKFSEKNGDWICIFCQYRLYYGDGRRFRRRTKSNNSNNGGDGGNPGDGGNVPDKTLAT